MRNYVKWRTVLSEKMRDLAPLRRNQLEEINNPVKQGSLFVGSVSFETQQVTWSEKNVILTKSEIFIFEKSFFGVMRLSFGWKLDDISKYETIIQLTPDTTCMELGIIPGQNNITNSFQLCTRAHHLILRHGSSKEAFDWMCSINQVLSKVEFPEGDELFDNAVDLIASDHFYRINDPSKDLDIIFDNVLNGWSIVKSSHYGFEVQAGSVLTSVGNKQVMLLSSAEGSKLFHDRFASMHLVFRAPLTKSGLITRIYPKGVTKKCRIRLKEGIVECVEIGVAKDIEKFDLSKFTLNTPNFESIGKLLCFYLCYGNCKILLQVDSSDDFISWCAAIIHATAISRGGMYVRRLDQFRLASYLNEVESRLISRASESLTHSPFYRGLLDEDIDIELNKVIN